MAIKTIFLDRDGVVNKEVRYLYKLSDFEFIDGIFDACLYFQKLGYEIVIVTNQSGIARGYYNENDYQKLTEWMLGQFNDNGINILDTFYCPHGPEENCECRKPKPGLILQAVIDFQIDLSESYMIGNSETDIHAAKNAGCKGILLKKDQTLLEVVIDLFESEKI